MTMTTAAGAGTGTAAAMKATGVQDATTAAMRATGAQDAATAASDPVGRVLGELPVLTPVRSEHVLLAVRAVVVHGPQEWPAGVVCRNDRAPYPCRLARWGRRVLVAAGVPEERVDSLVAAGDPYASPWA
jgi:hypothetical protein